MSTQNHIAQQYWQKSRLQTEGKDGQNCPNLKVLTYFNSVYRKKTGNNIHTNKSWKNSVLLKQNFPSALLVLNIL